MRPNGVSEHSAECPEHKQIEPRHPLPGRTDYCRSAEQFTSPVKGVTTGSAHDGGPKEVETMSPKARYFAHQDKERQLWSQLISALTALKVT